MKAKFYLLFLLLILIGFRGFGQGLIIDHTCTDVSLIPDNVLDSIKQNIRFQWCGQSHSHQIPTGLGLFEEDYPVFDVTINTDGNAWLPEPNGTFCVMDGLSMFNQCGNCCQAYIYPHAYWDGADAQNNVNLTLTNCYPSINVSGFLFCGELETADETYVENYLNAITNYEQLYPNVTFVYTTGHAQSNGANGYNRWLRNNQIRQYCIENDKILFDFADLDCWYNGEFNSYEYNGETVPLQHPQYDPDIIYHTTEESCKNKAKAIWYLMARVTGWQPAMVSSKPGTDLLNNNNKTIAIEISPNPFSAQTEIKFSLTDDSKTTVEIYDLQGRKIESLFDGFVTANEINRIAYKHKENFNSNYLVCIIRTSFGIAKKPLILLN